MRKRPSVEHPSFDGFIGELNQLGIEVATSGAPDSVKYAVLKASSVERWYLIPLKRSGRSARVFDLLSPMSRRSRLAKWIMIQLYTLGVFWPWARECIHLRSAGGKSCSHPWATATFFSGTPGAERKITVQLRTRRGSVNYLKIACTPLANQLVTHEVRALNTVSKLGLKTAILPSVLGFTSIHSRRSIFSSDETMPDFQFARKLGSAHFAFLEEMATKTEVQLGSSLVEEIMKRHAEWVEGADPGMKRLAEDVIREISDILLRATVRGSLAHGDFTPWNCRVAGSRLYVFDWEMSGYKPLGYDHLHFLFRLGVSDITVIRREMQERWHHGSVDGVQLLMLSYFATKMFSGEAGAEEPLRKVMSGA